MNEKRLEEKLREGIHRLGGQALKFAPVYYTGWPDRTVLIPGGTVMFAELKTTGAKPSPRQELRINWLSDNGFDVTVIDDADKLAIFMERARHAVRRL